MINQLMLRLLKISLFTGFSLVTHLHTADFHKVHLNAFLIGPVSCVSF